MKKIAVRIGDRISKITHEIYSRFAEHPERCVYNGVYMSEEAEVS